MESSPMTLSEVVFQKFGVAIDSSVARFSTEGWHYQGTCPVRCSDCDAGSPYEIFRKWYVTNAGRPQRFVALVCLKCRIGRTAEHLSSRQRSELKKWSDADEALNPVPPLPDDIASKKFGNGSGSSKSSLVDGQTKGTATGVGRKEVALPATSIPHLVMDQFGKAVDGGTRRFVAEGWSYVGQAPITCKQCRSNHNYEAYRKPGPDGAPKYWGLVCLNCLTVASSTPLNRDETQELGRWARSHRTRPTPESRPQTSLRGNERSVGVGQPDVRQPSVQSEASPSQAATPEREHVQPIGAAAPTGSTTRVPEGPQDLGPLHKEVLAAAMLELKALVGQAKVSEIGNAKAVDPSNPKRFRVASPSRDLGELPPGELFLATDKNSEQRGSSDFSVV